MADLSYAPASVRAPAQSEAAPFDASLFKADRRIHVQDSSAFTRDHLILLHPAELAPEHEPRLLAKLLKHYAIPHPHFLGMQPRNAVAFQMASLLPVAADVKLASVQKQLDRLKGDQAAGQDSDVMKAAERANAPFDALTRLYTDKPEQEPLEHYAVKQAATLYLVVNEALHQRGYEKEAAAYVQLTQTPEQVLAELEGKLGVSPRQFTEAARSGGIDGVAKALHVQGKALADIKQLADVMANHSFANNMVENWYAGRQQEGMESAGISEVLTTGIRARAGHLIASQRAALGGRYTTPAGVEAVEDKIVASLRMLPPELAEALYVSGTEFAYTPRPSLSSLDPASRGMLGYHQFVPFEPASTFGVRQIFVSARQNDREFDEVVTHEAHHALFPMQFSQAEKLAIDTLIQRGAERLNGERGLLPLTAAWKAAVNPTQRAAVEAEINERYGMQGLRLKDALASSSMHSLAWAVDDAWRNLDPNSDTLTKAYHSPEARAAELISRYAELKYVRMRDNAPMLDFIAPEMAAVYNNYYLPHLRKQLVQIKQDQQVLPPVLQNLSLPPSIMEVQAQQAALAVADPAQAAAAAEKPSSVVSAPSVISLSKVPMLIDKDANLAEGGHFVSMISGNEAAGHDLMVR